MSSCYVLALFCLFVCIDIPVNIFSEMLGWSYLIPGLHQVNKFLRSGLILIFLNWHIFHHTMFVISSGEEFTTVQGEVANILKGRLLVGHAIMNDLKVVFATCSFHNA